MLNKAFKDFATTQRNMISRRNKRKFYYSRETCRVQSNFIIYFTSVRYNIDMKYIFIKALPSILFRSSQMTLFQIAHFAISL